MRWRVDWVSDAGDKFAVAAYTDNLAEAVTLYGQLDALPSSEGVLTSTTVDAAKRARAQGGADPTIKKKDQSNRAYYMRMVLPAALPCQLHEEISQAEVIRRTGG